MIPPMNDRFRSPMSQSGLFAPDTLGRCDFYNYGLFYSYACYQKSNSFRFFTFFRRGGVMDPALWNPNGIDSGAESPESESIFSS